MLRMCIPKRYKQEEKQQKRPPGHHRGHRGSSSSTSSTETSSASKESHWESQASTISTSSSLAGVREMIPDGAINYRYKELLKATDNFDKSKKIGASTFRTKLRDAEVVIVHKKGNLIPEYKELISVLSSVHHINLVKFLGACTTNEGESIYICYEYEQGTNLKEALGSRNSKFTVLSSWTSRIQIALDIALALEYLHDLTMPTFIHKNITSSTIIVTNDLRAKIAKFGIPQLIGEIPFATVATAAAAVTAATAAAEDVRNVDMNVRKLVRSSSIKITGTPGYMAPENMRSGVVTEKSDVFAYGVVLAEILSGQHPGVEYDESGKVRMISMTDAVREVMEDDDGKSHKKLRLWIDSKMRDSYPLDCAYGIAVIAKQCLEDEPSLRPLMKNVTAKLSRYLQASLKWEAESTFFRDNLSTTMEGR